MEVQEAGDNFENRWCVVLVHRVVKKGATSEWKWQTTTIASNVYFTVCLILDYKNIKINIKSSLLYHFVENVYSINEINKNEENDVDQVD